MSDVTAQNIIERTLIDYDDGSTSAYYKMRRIVEALEKDGYVVVEVKALNRILDTFAADKRDTLSKLVGVQR